MKTSNKNTGSMHMMWQVENRTRMNDREAHNINKCLSRIEKTRQEKSKDIFLRNDYFDNFFTKLVHKS